MTEHTHITTATLPRVRPRKSGRARLPNKPAVTVDPQHRGQAGGVSKAANGLPSLREQYAAKRAEFLSTQRPQAPLGLSVSKTASYFAPGGGMVPERSAGISAAPAWHQGAESDRRALNQSFFDRYTAQ